MPQALISQHFCQRGEWVPWSPNGRQHWLHNLWRPLFKIIENFKMAAPHTKLSMGPFYTLDPETAMNPGNWPPWRIWWCITISSLVLWKGNKNREKPHTRSLTWKMHRLFHLGSFLGWLQWASPVAQWWRIHLICRSLRRFRLDSWVGKSPWRRTWQPTPVFLPGESHGQRRLVGYRPWGPKESDVTEVT